MERFTETLYDLLGVRGDASPEAIERAWDRYRAATRAEATPPDPRRDVLMRHAYETLTDAYRRAEYDASLRRESPVLRASRRSPRKVAAIVAAFIAATGAAAYLLRAQPKPSPKGVSIKPVAEISQALTRAVGRVKLIDLAGHETLLGVAVTIEEGVMATPCAGLSPSAQPMVVSAASAWPARVASDDPSGICRLEVTGGAGYPLPLTGQVPALGTTVYTVEVSATGQARVKQGSVTRLGGRQERALQASIAVDASNDGRPLVDADGRLAAIGVIDDAGGGRYVPIPSQWLPHEAPIAVSPALVREPPDPNQGSGTVPISPERQKRLNDTFRPPPKVPDGL
jgi:hypothetical protein